MSTEVGTAYVAIIPSAKGFARALQKSIAKEFAGSRLDRLISEELAGTTVSVPVRPEFKPGDVPDEIPVRPGREPKLPVKLDPLTKALQDDVRRELSKLSRDASAKIGVGAETDALRSEVATAISQVEATLSAQVPTEPAERREYERKLRAQVAEVSSQVKAHIHAEVDVDVDKPLRDGRVDAAGETVGRSLASGILSSLTSGLGTVGGPVMFAGVIAGAVVVAPLIGATIAAGVLAALGGGVIGLAFAALAQDPLMQRAASGLAGTIQSTLAKAAGPLLGTEEKPGPILLAMETLTDLVVELGPSLEQMFASIGPYIPTLAAGIAEFVRAVMPGLLDAVEASGPILEAIAFNLGPLGETLGNFLRVMAELGPAAVDALSVIFFVLRGVINLASGLLYILGAAFGGIYGWYESLRDRTSEFWQQITRIFSGGGASVRQRIEALTGVAIRLFRGLFDKLTGGTRSALGSVASAFGSVPGRIRSAVGSLGGLLFQAGRNVVNGLIGGLRSMFGPLGNTAGSLAGIIRNYLPFSPAKEGPLSGRGNPFYSGRSIVDLLASGVTANMGVARSAAADLAGTFALSGSPVASPFAGGYSGVAAATPAPGHLVAEWVGGDGDPIIRAIREHTRIYYGGSPQAAFAS